MKVPKKGKDSKNKVNKTSAVAKVKPQSTRKEQVLVVAQEIKYARLLSGNEKKTRDRVLKALKKWLTNCFEKGYEFKEDDFTRVWKGLFYAVWMSDKPLVQEELCESIAGILDLFPPEELRHALLMTKAGFKMLATEWYGIDQHRMDKFLMLVRRYLRGSLRCLARCDWSLDSCDKYAKMLSAGDGLFAPVTPHYARNAGSMLLHIVDCFLEELAKVSQGQLPAESVASVLAPFITYTCVGAAPALCAAARRLLTALLRQTDEQLHYDHKARAWQKMGCPEGGPDALELVSDGEEESEGQENGDAESDEESDDGERPLDPRAGRVDARVPQLPVPAGSLARRLRTLLPRAGRKAHARIRICIQRFEAVEAGQCPLKVSVPRVTASARVTPKRSLRALRALETKLKSDTDELKLRGLSRKHRKRLLRKTRLGLSIVEDVANNNNNKQKNGGWLVESTSTESDEKDTSNKENQNNKKNKKNKDTTQKRKLETQHNDVNNKKQKIDDKKVIKEKKESLVKKGKDDKKKIDKSDIKIKEKHTNKQTQKEPKAEEKVDIKKEKQTQKETKKELPKTAKVEKKTEKKSKKQVVEPPKTVINKLKNFSKQLKNDKTQKLPKEVKNFEDIKDMLDTPKKVKFVLKNNSMQKPVDYYKSVRQSPNIPFDSSKRPSKTNLKPSTPSPINPFFKKKLRMKH